MAKLSLSNISPINNLIINGDLNIWQRGTSFAAIAAGNYSADRFRYAKSGVMVHTVSRSTDVPTQAESGHLSNYSLLVDCTTIDASITGGDRSIIEQRIEGYDYHQLEGKYLTISFWVKATKTGIYCLALSNSGQDRSYVTEYTVTSSDTWEKQTVTVNMNYSGGTWDYTNGTGLSVMWTLAAGSTYQGVADTWNSAWDIATSNQVNACDSTANNFRIAQVKLEQGQVANPFVARPFAEELALCQRYYEKSYDQGTDPGSATTVGMIELRENAVGTGTIMVPVRFKVEKADTPTVTAYDTAGTSGTIYKGASGKTAVVQRDGTSGVVIGTADATNASQYLIHFTADAEL